MSRIQTYSSLRHLFLCLGGQVGLNRRLLQQQISSDEALFTPAMQKFLAHRSLICLSSCLRCRGLLHRPCLLLLLLVCQSIVARRLCFGLLFGQFQCCRTLSVQPQHLSVSSLSLLFQCMPHYTHDGDLGFLVLHKQTMEHLHLQV